jgi:hypothetical protein
MMTFKIQKSKPKGRSFLMKLAVCFLIIALISGTQVVWAAANGGTGTMSGVCQQDSTNDVACGGSSAASSGGSTASGSYSTASGSYSVGDHLELTPNDRLNLTPLFLFPFLNF